MSYLYCTKKNKKQKKRKEKQLSLSISFVTITPLHKNSQIIFFNNKIENKTFKFQIFFLKNYTKKAHQSIFCFFFLSLLSSTDWWLENKKIGRHKTSQFAKLHPDENASQSRDKEENSSINVAFKDYVVFLCFYYYFSKKKKPQKYIFLALSSIHIIYLFCLIEKKKSFTVFLISN